MMIVVAILGILTAIALPMYNSQLERGRRAECRSGLLQAMQQQERRFTSVASYSITLGADGVRTFSGDSAATSACDISAVRTDGGATNPITGVRLVGTMRAGFDRTVSTLTLDTSGQRACTLIASGATLITGNTTCWP